MPLIRADEIGEDLEDHAVKEGQYEVRIVKSEYKITKSQEDHMIVVTLAIQGQDGEGASPISHYLTEPKDDDEPRIKRMRLRDLKRFLTVFGVPFDKGFDMEEQARDLVGCTAKLLVTQEKYEGNVQNRLRLPRID